MNGDIIEKSEVPMVGFITNILLSYNDLQPEKELMRQRRSNETLRSYEEEEIE